MKKYVTSRKFAYISVASFHLLAHRMGDLFCSVDTCYKYIRCFEWKRPWVVRKKEIQKTGIRDTRTNEIWHLDVTVVNIRPGYKLYIQAVIDNFSRFVLAWRVTETVNAQNTIETLNLAKTKATELLAASSQDSTQVMMDPGTENKNGKVLQFIVSQNLVRTLETRRAEFYFREHNHVIPLAAHNGARPAEVFLSSWGEKEQNELRANKLAALLLKEKRTAPPLVESAQHKKGRHPNAR